MGEEKHINYSAADIERYHKKLLSAKEMHAMEKAALDDPFLADALEGYAAMPMNAESDIVLLREKINKRVNAEAKVVPMKGTGFPWLRVAALVIVIAGAGLLAYQFVFTTKSKEVAKAEAASDKKLSPAASDTNLNEKEQETAAGKTVPTDSQKNNLPVIEHEEIASDRSDKVAAERKGKKDYKQDTISRAEEIASAPANPLNAPTKAEDKNDNTSLSEVSVVPQSKKASEPRKSQADTDVVNDDFANNKDKHRAFNKEISNGRSGAQNNQANIFRGQVLDAQNSPLPFANITNTKDNVGTYTDVKGNFTLISPDSALNVQVRSVGFENTNTQLQNNVSSNAIILQQDLKNIPLTTVSNKKVNTERAKQSTMVLEEPEPYDGWYNYDTYIANNINIPDEIRQKRASTGEVELSFDVNKNGEPVNITVEKSACKECDEEAIRLLKEGPKWKKKKKNRRARLNVVF